MPVIIIVLFLIEVTSKNVLSKDIYFLWRVVYSSYCLGYLISFVTYYKDFKASAVAYMELRANIEGKSDEEVKDFLLKNNFKELDANSKKKIIRKVREIRDKKLNYVQ